MTHDDLEYYGALCDRLRLALNVDTHDEMLDEVLRLKRALAESDRVSRSRGRLLDELEE